MKRRLLQLTFCVTVLVGVVGSAGPAQAIDWTPYNTAISASATNATLSNGTETITCTSDLTGTTGFRDDNLSLRVTFTSCRGGTVSCRDNNVTFRAVSAQLPAGTGEAEVWLDLAFHCVWTGRCTWTIFGPQRLARTVRLAANTLTVNVGPIIADRPPTLCGFNAWYWTGTYSISTPRSVTLSPF